MKNYLNQYSQYSNVNRINYTPIQKVYSTSYSSPSTFSINPRLSYQNNASFNNAKYLISYKGTYRPIKSSVNTFNTSNIRLSYPNNVGFNNVNNIYPYNSNYKPVETSLNSLGTANQFNINSGTYSTPTIQILPNINSYNNISYPINSIKYNSNGLHTNNIINTTHQPLYQNISYANTMQYNNMSVPISYIPSNNILEMTARSSNTIDYGTITTPISFNNIGSINLGSNRQNNDLFRSFQPVMTNQNSKLISHLRNSYFNNDKDNFTIFSYNPSPVRYSTNYSSLSNGFLTNNINIQPRYSVTSAPLPQNIDDIPEIDDDLLAIEETELIPIKRTKYLKKTRIIYPLRKSLIEPKPIKKSYYIPKDKMPSTNLTRLPARISKIDEPRVSSPLSPIRFSGRLETLSPASSYRTDYPYDNFGGDRAFSPRVYRINLSKEKRRKRKFY